MIKLPAAFVQKIKYSPSLMQYIDQHFNPIILPTLIIELLQNNQIYNQQIVRLKYNKNFSNKLENICGSQNYYILRSSDFSVWLANMKMYNHKQIQRENCLFQYFQKSNIQLGNIDKLKQNKVYKQSQQHVMAKQQKLNNKIRAQTQESQSNKNKEFYRIITNLGDSKNKYKTFNNLKQQHFQKLFKFFQLNYQAFIQYQYRLADLITVIQIIYSKNQKNITNSNVYEVIQILQSLSNCIIQKLTQTKQILQGITIKYTQVAGNQKLKLQKMNDKFNERNLFLLRDHAKYLIQHTKIVNKKYAKISKDTALRQNKYKKQYKQSKYHGNQEKKQGLKNQIFNSITCKEKLQLNQKQEQKNANQKDKLKHKINSKILIKNKKLNNKKKYSQHKDLLYSYNQSNDQILLSKRQFLKNKNKEKKIQTDLTTGSAQQKMNNKKKQQFSKFKHREGISLNLTNDAINKNLVNLADIKKKMKQVRIQTKHNQKQGIQSQIYSQSDLKNQNILKIQMFEELCQKIQDLPMEDKNFFKKYFSCNQLNQYQDENQSSITGVTSKNNRSVTNYFKNRKNSKKMYKRNSTSKQPKNQIQKSYNSCENFQDMKRANKSKQKLNIKQSLKQILFEAINQKMKNKNTQRQQKILTEKENEFGQDIDKQNIFNMALRKKQQKYFHRLSKISKNILSKQKNTKIILNKRKEQKQRQKDFLYLNFYKEGEQANQIKSSRRIGIDTGTGNMRNSKKTQLIERNYQKSPSQHQSIKSQKKYQIGNKKVINNKDSIINEQHKTNKTKTQFTYLNLSQYKIPNQYTVRKQDMLNFNNKFVNFYSNIECSLYRITKKNERLQFMNNFQNENRMLEFIPISKFDVKKKVNRNLQIQDKQKQMQNKMFLEENKKILFSRRMVTAANQLYQKSMSSIYQFRDSIN